MIEEEEIMIRGKWIMDGADTLAEASQLLREYADHIDSLDKEGWELGSTVVDDYGFLYK